MMDWSGIITALIAALVPTGGLTAIVTLRDKKTAAFLENAKEVIGQWQQIAEDRTKRAKELKEDLDAKDAKIDALYREKDTLRKEKEGLLQELDTARTEKAVADLVKCLKTKCTDREPPFGQGNTVKCKVNGNNKQ